RYEIESRFYAEGRLKLEPWLIERLNRADLRVMPNAIVLGAQPTSDGGFRAWIAGATELEENFGRRHLRHRLQSRRLAGGLSEKPRLAHPRPRRLPNPERRIRKRLRARIVLRRPGGRAQFRRIY